MGFYTPKRNLKVDLANQPEVCAWCGQVELPLEVLRWDENQRKRVRAPIMGKDGKPVILRPTYEAVTRPAGMPDPRLEKGYKRGDVAPYEQRLGRRYHTLVVLDENVPRKDGKPVIHPMGVRSDCCFGKAIESNRIPVMGADGKPLMRAVKRKRSGIEVEIQLPVHEVEKNPLDGKDLRLNGDLVFVPKVPFRPNALPEHAALLQKQNADEAREEAERWAENFAKKQAQKDQRWSRDRQDFWELAVQSGIDPAHVRNEAQPQDGEDDGDMDPAAKAVFEEVGNKLAAAETAPKASESPPVQDQEPAPKKSGWGIW